MPRKPDPKKSTFVTASHMAREFSVNNGVVEGVIKRAKLKPESSMPYATGVMRLYLRDKLTPLVLAHLDARAEKQMVKQGAAIDAINKAAAASQPTAPTENCADPCLAEMAKHLAINDATLEGMRETQATLQQQVGLLLQQNRELFGVLKAVQGDTSVLAAGLIGGGAS